MDRDKIIEVLTDLIDADNKIDWAKPKGPPVYQLQRAIVAARYLLEDIEKQNFTE